MNTQASAGELAPTIAASSVNMARGVLTARHRSPFQRCTKTRLLTPMPDSQASRLPTLAMVETGPPNVRICDQADGRVTDPRDATASPVAAARPAIPNNSAAPANRGMDRTTIAATPPLAPPAVISIPGCRRRGKAAGSV